jgi:hypothetical protein
VGNTAQVDLVLLLLGALTRLLATDSGNKVFFFVTAECLALWKLFARALVWLANGNLFTKLGLFPRNFSKMLIVALGLDLWLFWFTIATSIVSSSCRFRSPGVSLSVDGSWDRAVEAILLFFLGNSVSSLLVGQLCVSRVVAPAVSSLLVLLAGNVG